MSKKPLYPNSVEVSGIRVVKRGPVVERNKIVKRTLISRPEIYYNLKSIEELDVEGSEDSEENECWWSHPSGVTISLELDVDRHTPLSVLRKIEFTIYHNMSHDQTRRCIAKHLHWDQPDDWKHIHIRSRGIELEGEGDIRHMVG